jgi:restriction system protein
MKVPKYNEMMLPLLKFLEDGNEHTSQEILNYLAKYFDLSYEDINLRMPTGNRTYFNDRFNWAKTYLRKAKLIESISRTIIVITERGKTVLREQINEISRNYLMRFPEFVEFVNRTSDASMITSEKIEPLENDISPEEAISVNYSRLLSSLSDDLQDKITSCSPTFFETLVVDLLVKMGYGGTVREAGEVVGKSGDGGIDGLIKEDRLGLDVVYIQAKRWEGNVGSKEIQAFVGALAGKKAKKGVFITTSSFTKAATDFVGKIDFKVILVDGKQLADLMIEFNLGVSVRKVYDIKQIDQDYFEIA